MPKLNTIKPIRSTTPGSPPGVGTIEDGELAMNSADRFLYTSHWGDIVRLYDREKVQIMPGSTLGETIQGGTILRKTLTSALIVVDTIEEGQSITLHLERGDQHPVTFPTNTIWYSDSTPGADTVYVFWKVQNKLRAFKIGDAI